MVTLLLMIKKRLGLDEPSFSNGSAYGDLDNDGDLDLVVNNVIQRHLYLKTKQKIITISFN